MLFLALELEWCRAWACAHRWQEECLLLNEEMRRVLAFFKWQVSDWRQKLINWNMNCSQAQFRIQSLWKLTLTHDSQQGRGKLPMLIDRQAYIIKWLFIFLQCGRIYHTNCFTWRLPMPVSKSNFIDNLMYLLDIDIDMFKKHYYAMILGLSIGIYNAR